MKKQTITNLTRFSLADKRFLFHPECAEWDESGSSGDVYDAAGKKGLRAVCATCGALLEEAPPLPSASHVQCPECGGQWFLIAEFRKEKPQPSAPRVGIRRHADPAAPACVPPSPAKPASSFLTSEKLKDWIGAAAVKTCFAYILALFGFEPRD